MSLTQAELGAIFVTLLRAAAIAATAPVIGDSGVPMRARLVFVVALALAVGVNREPIPLEDVPATGLIELATGLVIGMSARFIMSSVANAGQLMGLSLGLGFANQYDVHAGESAQTLRTIATTVASLAFVVSGGLDAVARAVAASPSHVTDLLRLGPDIMRQGTAAFGHGLALAGPVVLAAVVGNLGLAVMNRAAPAINVFSIALPVVLLIGGGVMLAGSAGFIGSLLDTARDAIDVMR